MVSYSIIYHLILKAILNLPIFLLFYLIFQNCLQILIRPYWGWKVNPSIGRPQGKESHFHLRVQCCFPTGMAVGRWVRYLNFDSHFCLLYRFIFSFWVLPLEFHLFIVLCSDDLRPLQFFILVFHYLNLIVYFLYYLYFDHFLDRQYF